LPSARSTDSGATPHRAIKISPINGATIENAPGDTIYLPFGGVAGRVGGGVGAGGGAGTGPSGDSMFDGA